MDLPSWIVGGFQLCEASPLPSFRCCCHGSWLMFDYITMLEKQPIFEHGVFQSYQPTPNKSLMKQPCLPSLLQESLAKLVKTPQCTTIRALGFFGGSSAAFQAVQAFGPTPGGKCFWRSWVLFTKYGLDSCGLISITVLLQFVLIIMVDHTSQQFYVEYLSLKSS